MIFGWVFPFHKILSFAYSIMNKNEGIDVKMLALEYFPGANTPKGFYSYYDYILKSNEAKRIVVLKGGPGTGKSSFMKKIAQHLLSLGYETELLHCSSDPHSLDGVCARQIGFLILDGTSPHVVDPKCPGAVDEIINLGECWDAEKICKRKTEIIDTGNKISSCFASAYRYLEAAKSLQNQIRYDYSKIVDMDFVRGELEKTAKELNLSQFKSKKGWERKAFLSAITPLGRINYIDTFIKKAKYVYKIKSASPQATELFMGGLCQMLKNNGHNIRTFYCPMSPDEKIEHIYADGIFFTVENEYHRAESASTQHIINLDNYPDGKNISPDHAADINQYNALLERAEQMVTTAKKLHDELEEYYIPYMDFSKVGSLSEDVIKSIN